MFCEQTNSIRFKRGLNIGILQLVTNRDVKCNWKIDVHDAYMYFENTLSKQGTPSHTYAHT